MRAVKVAQLVGFAGQADEGSGRLLTRHRFDGFADRICGFNAVRRGDALRGHRASGLPQVCSLSLFFNLLIYSSYQFTFPMPSFKDASCATLSTSSKEVVCDNA